MHRDFFMLFFLCFKFWLINSMFYIVFVMMIVEVPGTQVTFVLIGKTFVWSR